MDYEQDLYLDQEDEEEEKQVSQWRIEDDATADWALRKIDESLKTIDRHEVHYRLMLEKIRNAEQRKIDFFRSKLYEYFGTLERVGVVKHTKTQDKYSLPSGDLVLTHAKKDYKRDDDVLTEWLIDNIPELVKTKVTQTPNWQELKKLLIINPDNSVSLADTGEIIHCITAVDVPQKFDIKKRG